MSPPKCIVYSVNDWLAGSCAYFRADFARIYDLLLSNSIMNLGSLGVTGLVIASTN